MQKHRFLIGSTAKGPTYKKWVSERETPLPEGGHVEDAKSARERKSLKCGQVIEELGKKGGNGPDRWPLAGVTAPRNLADLDRGQVRMAGDG